MGAEKGGKYVDADMLNTRELEGIIEIIDNVEKKIKEKGKYSV